MTAVDTPIYWSVLVDQARADGAAYVAEHLRLEVCWCGATLDDPCPTCSGHGSGHKGQWA